jgi:hypothetical protein
MRTRASKKSFAKARLLSVEKEMDKPRTTASVRKAAEAKRAPRKKVAVHRPKAPML